MRKLRPGLVGLTLVVALCAGASAVAASHHAVDLAKLRGKEFKTLAAAKAACGASPVVWVNTKGIVFHMEQSRWFGHTRAGVYSCRNAAKAAGFWQSKY